MTRCLLFWLLALAVTPVPAQTATEIAAAPASTAAPVNPYPLAIDATQVSSKADETLRQYPRTPPEAGPDAVKADVERRLLEKNPELEVFADEAARVLAKNPTLDHLRASQNLVLYFSRYPQEWSGAIVARTTELASKLKQIDADKAVWTDTQKALGPTSRPATPVLPETLKRIGDVLARLDATRVAVIADQTGLLALENRVNEFGNRLDDLKTRLDQARSQAIAELFDRQAPPLWSGTPPGVVTALEGPTWSRQVQSLRTYAGSETGKFAGHLALFGGLAMVFYWLRSRARRWAAQAPGEHPPSPIFEAPLAAAAFFALLPSPLIYYPIAPRLLLALFGAVALVPGVVLLRRLIAPRLFPVLYALVAFFFLEEYRAVAALAPGAARAFFLAELLAAIAFLAWLFFRLRQGETSAQGRFAAHVPAAIKLTLLALAVAWAANVLGYILLGDLLGKVVQRSATLALLLYAGLRIVDEALLLATRLRPLSHLGLVRDHGPMLLDRVGRALDFATALFWLVYVLDLLSLREPVFGWLGDMLTTRNEKHLLVLSLPGKLLVAAFIGWGIFQLSAFARFILQTDFYPRLRLSAGIPYAISTSLHYALLVVAFVAATSVLGIDMTKFTILVSALGVGVGFGLQNIINNFVSGLILLFERPVKIGDSIQSGDAVGVVERIGIRASVLRTTSGSEMIVPNGNLISNAVTNWTFSSQERIVAIPFSVVRGPDVAHLMDLFIAAAAAHPRVLRHPAPQVLAVSLGANLGFEVRAWTRANEDWTQVRSDLVVAINAALARENIALA